jgi:glycosyltransferase involved in cell wall biosynthesis
MKFSIITITMNSREYLDETISSVLSQEYRNLEYIIVDGGSSDGTLDTIKEYARKDVRIRWISEPDQGIADAMNKGVLLATGDVIAHLHSDDRYVDASVLSRVATEFARHPEALWLTGGEHVIDQHGRIIQQIKVRRYSYRKLVRCNFILHPATFVRSAGFQRAGLFNITRKYAMDYDLWLRLGTLGKPIPVDAPLACFRLHGGSLSSSETEKAFDEALDIRKELMKGQPIRFFFHYLYYLAKKQRNRTSVRKLLQREDLSGS